MLRTHWMTSSAAAKNYFAQSDYYASCPGDWLGKGAERLGLAGAANQMHFYSLADNLDPRTGEQLTAAHRENRRVGMDLTFNSTKSVGIARELAGPANAGDPRIEAAHREAVAYAMGFVERDMQTRVRIGGADDDRATGNMVAYRVTHRDTRINADDQRPDMSLHDHVFVFNATYDPVEQRWKAAQMGQIKHDAPYYEAIYHNRLAHNLKELGYGIRRSGKAFEIEGVSRELIEKFSRRRQYIKDVAEKLGIASAAGMDKLGATTRLGKAKEPADDLNAYYVSRLTDKEREQLAKLEGKPSYECSTEKAMQFAIAHEFERQSVIEERKLYETAIRHGIGSVTPEAVIEESRRQGVLLRENQATTRDVLAEESRIIGFAREGKGTMRPMAESGIGNTAAHSPEQRAAHQRGNILLDLPNGRSVELSPEQYGIARHVWESPDQVILIRGAAGTGKTHTMKATLAGIDKPVAVLAPTVDASRGVLRKEGFKDADTVAAFLQDAEWQSRVKVIYVDEAGLLPIKDLARLVDIAREHEARIILQGDPRQHKSVLRHGNMFAVLQQYAGLGVAELRTIRRQENELHRQAVSAIESGKIEEGHRIIREQGWIQQVETEEVEKRIADKCWENMQKAEDFIVVGITHKQNDAITGGLRKRLKEENKLGQDDVVIERLKRVDWTEAQQADLGMYEGSEVVQFGHNYGPYRAGQRVSGAYYQALGKSVPVKHFAVYTRDAIALAPGDRVRATAGGVDVTGKHRINNGAFFTYLGKTADGNLALESENGNHWVVKRDFGHLTYGLVNTSFKAQGQTKVHSIGALTQQNIGGINAEQYYVTLSRPKKSVTIVTDLEDADIRRFVQRADQRKSATELMRPKRITRKQKFLERARDDYEALPDRFQGVTRDRHAEREVTHCR